MEPIPQEELDRLREVQKHLTTEEKKKVRKSLSDVKKTAEAGIAAIEQIEARGRSRSEAEGKQAARKTEQKPRKGKQAGSGTNAGRAGAKDKDAVENLGDAAGDKEIDEIVRNIDAIIGPEGAPDLNPNDEANRERIGINKSAEKSKNRS